MSSLNSTEACVDCDPQPSASSSASPPKQTPDPSADPNLLNSSTFIPPDLSQEPELPRLVIEFCDRCRWFPRASWTQTELFLTFPPSSPNGLKSITLVPRTAPETGGRFRVWLYRYRTLEEEFEQSVGKEKWDGAELVYDRKIEGGFPELKDLKQRIRNIIAPTQDLGHSDKGPIKPRDAPIPEPAEAVGSSGGNTSAHPSEPSADDYTPRFRC